MFQHCRGVKTQSSMSAYDPSIDFSSCIVCTICLTLYPAAEVVVLECGCSHCACCLALQFSNQLSQLDKRSRFGLAGNRPKCCSNPIPIEKVDYLLPSALVKSIDSRTAEINSRDRTYCYEESCSTFIADHSIHNGQGFCQKCRKTTCVKCKAKWHFGPCNHGKYFERMLALVESEQWRSCPTCQNAISRIEGCSYML